MDDIGVRCKTELPVADGENGPVLQTFQIGIAEQGEEFFGDQLAGQKAAAAVSQ